MSKIFVRANVTLEIGLNQSHPDDKTLKEIKEEMVTEINRRLLKACPDPEVEEDRNCFNGYRILKTEIMQVNHE